MNDMDASEFPEFNPVSEASFRDPASIVTARQAKTPVFYHEPMGLWVVTKYEDAERVVTDWETFTSSDNAPDAPPEVWDRFPKELIKDMITNLDPPRHTPARRLLQASFVKPKIDPLAPIIEARANEIIDEMLAGPEVDPTDFDLMNRYCLNLTTKTLMALLDLPDEDRPYFEQLRNDSIMILISNREPLPKEENIALWDRFIKSNEYFRNLVEERRNSDGIDIISTMASARTPDGDVALSTERIALHCVEVSFAGTDTTAQAMANAMLFLADNPKVIEEAQKNPDLWSRVFEETVRRRPSAPFAARVPNEDVVLSGVTIKKGEPIWISLAGANTDPDKFGCPMDFDIHRDKPADHLAFTKGRHTCPGAPLARLQGSIGLRVLHERLPTIRAIKDQPLDFADVALLPVRESLRVSW